MAGEAIAPEVREFILRHIDSIAQLEALLLLRANANEEWDASRTAKRLYATEVEVAEALARLCEHGLLVSREGRYRFHCATPRLAAAVERLAEAHARQLIPVTALIHSKPPRIRLFANAFRFRKSNPSRHPSPRLLLPDRPACRRSPPRVPRALPRR